MFLTSKEQIEKELFRQKVENTFLPLKQEMLSQQLQHFLTTNAEARGRAFTFEFDYYLGFSYVGYPHYLMNDILIDNIIINASSNDDGVLMDELMKGIMNNDVFDVEIRERICFDVFRQCTAEIFCKSWIRAKEKVNVDTICFVEMHESTSGYDCDTLEYVNESQIEAKIESTFEL